MQFIFILLHFHLSSKNTRSKYLYTLNTIGLKILIVNVATSERIKRSCVQEENIQKRKLSLERPIYTIFFF